MLPRQTRPPGWPRRWLVTDERMGDALWSALRRLPRGSGVLFRHGRLDAVRRERLGRMVARECRRRSLTLAVAGDSALARRLGASLVHNPASSPGLIPFSRSVHDQREALASRAAALVFISPVYPTSSHPGSDALGPDEARRLARLSGVPAILLGGMDERRYARLRGRGFAGYAGIDCWIRI